MPADVARWEADVVLADGGVAHVRPIRPEDAEALVEFHHRQSPESLYYRYFSPKPTLTPDEVRHLVEVDYDRRMAFVAEADGQLLGVGRYDAYRGRNEAEVAFMVDDAHRGRGLATIFLEYLIAAARDAGFDELVAEVLPDNRRMLAVFERAGFDAHRQFAEGVIEVELSLADTEEAQAAMEDREQRAEARSVANLLAPRSVAVIGAPDVHAQLVTHGFPGPVVLVEEGQRIEDVPDAIDLAVVGVPPDDLLSTLEACGQKGVRGAVVLTPTATAPEGLVDHARRFGLRLVGPGALGLVNTASDVCLHASPLGGQVPAGPIGFLSQSGSLAAALVDRAAAAGLGFSSVVAVGDKADVSANDLLQYWDTDDATRVVALYLQSFGNPRKFARIARRVSRRTPIVAVKSGRAPVADRGEEWPDDMLDALLVQTGVIRVDTTEELLDVCRVLADQPVPAGGSAALVANRFGPLVLAADACAGAGLRVEATTLLDNDADPAAFAEAVRTALAEVDAALVVWAAPAGGEPEATLEAAAEVARSAGKPVVATAVGQHSTAPPLPTFAFPERAARTLGRVAAYGSWLSRPAGAAPVFGDADRDAARSIVRAALDDAPAGRDLTAVEAEALLGAFAMRTPEQRVVNDAGEARAAAEALPAPLAIKALRLEHLGKVEAQGLALDLHEPQEVEAAYQRMCQLLGDDAMCPALVQQMVDPGADIAIHLHQHPRWGSTVSVGVGGAVAPALGEGPLRVVPLTDLDAGRLVDASPVPRLLEAAGVEDARPQVEELILRVSVLADALPEVAGLLLNPVIVGGGGAWVTSAKATVRPWTPGPDPRLRRL